MGQHRPGLLQRSKAWLRDLLAPATEPRLLVDDPQLHQDQLWEKVREAQAQVRRLKAWLDERHQRVQARLPLLAATVEENRRLGQWEMSATAADLLAACEEEKAMLERHLR